MKRFRYWWCLLAGHDFECEKYMAHDVDAYRYMLRCRRCRLVWPRVLEVTMTMLAASRPEMVKRHEQRVRTELERLMVERRRAREASPEEYEVLIT